MNSFKFMCNFLIDSENYFEIKNKSLRRDNYNNHCHINSKNEFAI